MLTGRPLGDVNFIEKMEVLLDRKLKPQKPGPKKKIKWGVPGIVPRNYYFLKPPLIAVDPNRFYRSGERNNDMFTSPKNQWRKHELEPIN